MERGTYPTFFLLSSGEIDQIDMIDWTITAANQLAQQLGARYFYRVINNHGAGDLHWGCYRTVSDDVTSTWARKKLEPFKVVRSPDSSPAEMLCRMKAATT